MKFDALVTQLKIQPEALTGLLKETPFKPDQEFSDADVKLLQQIKDLKDGGKVKTYKEAYDQLAPKPAKTTAKKTTTDNNGLVKAQSGAIADSQAVVAQFPEDLQKSLKAIFYKHAAETMAELPNRSAKEIQEYGEQLYNSMAPALVQMYHEEVVAVMNSDDFLKQFEAALNKGK